MALRKARTSGTERAFQVIQCLVDIGAPATAYQIAKKLKAPLSTIYDTIGTLEKLGIVDRGREEGKFFLGLKIYLFGLAYTRNMQEDEVYKREVQDLADKTGVNTHLLIRDGDDLVVTNTGSGPGQFTMTIKHGHRIPMCWTASGWIFLSFLSREEVEGIIARSPQSPDSRVVPTHELLDGVRRDLREKGYIVQQQNLPYGVGFIACPIRNNDGKCVATISFALPTIAEVIDQNSKERIEMLLATSHRIEKLLGWQPPSYEEGR